MSNCTIENCPFYDASEPEYCGHDFLTLTLCQETNDTVGVLRRLDEAINKHYSDNSIPCRCEIYRVLYEVKHGLKEIGDNDGM